MGSQSQKTKTKTVTTPIVPGWVEQPMQDYVGQIGDLAQTDPSQYVTGPNQNQQDAFDAAGNLGGWQATNDQAADIYGEVAGGGANLIDQTHTANAALLSGMDIDAYQDPYLQDVVDTTLAGYDQNAAMQQAAMEAERARTQGFAGSRSAIGQALLTSQQGMGRAAAEAGLRSGAYDRAMGWMGEDANRQQGVNLFNAGSLNQTEALNQAALDSYGNRQLGAASGLNAVANSSADNERADIGAQLGAGEIERAIAQAQATGDFSFLQAIGQLYGGAQMPMFVGQNQNGTTTSTQNPGILGTIGQVAGTAGSIAALFSDIRLKKDVETVRHEGARRRVSWRWLWQGPDAPKTEGYIAQEILKTDPQAVGECLGFLTVNEGLFA